MPKAWTDMVAAAIRTVFALPGATHVGAQLEEIARMLEAQFPDVSRLLVEARDDLLAFAAFPAAHWKKICSTNPLERLNGEIKRRTQVAGIFPNDAAVLRLITALIVDTHDEWQVAERRYLPEESMTAVAAVDRTGPEPLPESPLAVTA